MTDKNCLNCEKELVGDFCFGCGQKANTHRITFKNFIFHDLLHGTFHIDRGILYTAKQAFTRPGKAALDYISGKRKRYYNVFYLILITIGLMLFFRHIHTLFPGYVEDNKPDPTRLMNEATKRMDHIFDTQSKFLLLLFVPFGAINSFVIFRRKKLNLSEHAIISGMILLGILLVSMIGNFIFTLNRLVHFSYMVLSILVAIAINIYVIYGYYNAFARDYTKLGMAYRMLLFYVLICIEIMLVGLVLIGIVTDWKFGLVNIAPFG